MINFINTNKKTLYLFDIIYFLIVNYLVFILVKETAISLRTFDDEINSLASNYNFFTTLNFDARPLIPGNYGTGLTSGPLSAVGGVIGWGLTKSILVSRISNFYYIVILQLLFSYLLKKHYSFNFNKLIMFSIIQITLIPWWLGSLYSIGEFASTVIFVNSIILFPKKRQLSLLLFSSCIIYGKFLLMLPFLAFYISYLIIQILNKKKIENIIKDISIFVVPFIIWYLLIIFKTSFKYFLTYLSEFTGMVLYFDDAGLNTLNKFSIQNIINQISSSEVSMWSTASLVRISIVPILFGILLIRNREIIKKTFELSFLPIFMTVFSTYIWFWLLSPQKYMRYTKHFTIIIVFFLFYFLILEMIEDRIDYLLIFASISLFFSDLKLIIFFNLVILLILFIIKNIGIKNIALRLSFLIFLVVNLQLSINETKLKNEIDLRFPSCVESLTSEKCYTSYINFKIKNGF